MTQNEETKENGDSGEKKLLTQTMMGKRRQAGQRQSRTTGEGVPVATKRIHTQWAARPAPPGGITALVASGHNACVQCAVTWTRAAPPRPAWRQLSHCRLPRCSDPLHTSPTSGIERIHFPRGPLVIFRAYAWALNLHSRTQLLTVGRPPITPIPTPSILHEWECPRYPGPCALSEQPAPPPGSPLIRQVDSDRPTVGIRDSRLQRLRKKALEGKEGEGSPAGSPAGQPAHACGPSTHARPAHAAPSLRSGGVL